MPAIGTRGTASLSARKYDMADVISLLDVNRYPLLAILTNAGKDPVTKQGKALKKKETTDPEFKWFEDAYQSRVLANIDFIRGSVPPYQYGTFQTHGGNPGDGKMYFADFQVGDVIMYPETKWVFIVKSVASNGWQLGVDAPLGGETLDGNKTTGSELWIIGNANEEGIGLRVIKGTTPSEKFGYCQIFRTPFGVTETTKNTQTLIKENDFDYQRRKKAIEHMVDIERAFLFSDKAKIIGTHPKRFTAGILKTIKSYATANVDTEAEFEAWLESAFAHGNVEKYLLSSAALVSMINGWAKGKLETLSKDKTYGLTIIQYVSPHGTVNIMKHPLLTGTPYGNYGVMLDLECLTYRYLSNRDTKLLTNRQNPGDDERVDEYLTECGLQIEQESRHAIMSKSSL